MFIGQITGNVVSTIKSDSLIGSKLLVLKKIDMNTMELTGTETVAIDTVSAGIGDRVLVFKEGGSAKIVLKSKDSHVAQVIVGIVDEIDLNNWKKI